MNPKIIVGGVIAAFVIIIAIIGLAGSSLISDVSNKGLFPTPTQTQILPLEVELQEISIIEADESAAVINLKLKVKNPNQKSIILQFVKYSLYENNLRIHAGEIGQRFEGGLVGSSNYYTILSESETVLSDKIVIKNSGNTPELWNALLTNTPKWKIEGEAFFNLSSMTSGQENEIKFELYP